MLTRNRLKRILTESDRFLTNGTYNEKKLNIIYESYLKKDWDDFFALFTTKFYFLLFLEISQELSEIDYWKHLIGAFTGEVYTSLLFFESWYLLENPNRDLSKRFHMMNPYRRNVLKSSNGKKIYRGCLDGFELGFSWTFSKKVAKFFADRQSGNVKILEAEFDDNSPYAYIASGEKEILINPISLNNIKVVEKYQADQTEYQKTYSYGHHLLATEFTRKSKAFKKLWDEINESDLYLDFEYYQEEYKPEVLELLEKEGSTESLQSDILTLAIAQRSGKKVSHS